MEQQHFFDKAPTIGWFTWIQRRLIPFSKPMKQIAHTPQNISKSCLDNVPKKATSSHAQEYSDFLYTHYTGRVKLRIPPQLFEKYLQTTLIGVELRDHDGHLVGVVFSWYTGKVMTTTTTTTPSGLITWLCVHSSWRKKGIADCLLFAIELFTKERPIHFFRNDGWLKSPLPPLYTQSTIYRKSNLYRSSIQIQKVPIEKHIETIRSVWLQENPNGIFLYEKDIPSLVEVWEYKSNILIIQPTFEVEHEKSSKSPKHWCEILYWIGNNNVYQTSINLEVMIDALPYDYIEAPRIMPHIVSNWKHGGQTTWTTYGLDPGTPVTRPILSLLAS